MTRGRLFSSDEIAAALRRAGFSPRKKSRGSHQTWTKPKPDGAHWVTVIVLDRSEVPRGTLDAILAQAGLSHEEFLILAEIKSKG